MHLPAAISLLVFTTAQAGLHGILNNGSQVEDWGYGARSYANRCVFYNPASVAYYQDKAEDTIVAANLVFRHGGRTPSNFVPTDPFKNLAKYWPEGKGMLTPEGRVMASQLGSYIKARYDGFISNQSASGELCVQTSDKQRAIDTAKLVVSAIYPGAEIQLLQVNHVVDNKLQFTAVCPFYNTSYNQFLSSNQDIQNLYKDKAEILKEIPILAGISPPIQNFGPIYQIADTLWTECQNGYCTPHWAKYYPYETQPFHNLEFISWTATPELARFEAGPLLYEHLQNFKLHLLNQSSYENTMQNITINKSKLYLYSAHDPTISTLLNSLGVYGDLRTAMYSPSAKSSLRRGLSPVPPTYTSQFIFELHCKNDICKKYPTVYEFQNYPNVTFHGNDPTSLLPQLEMYYDVVVYIKPRKDLPHVWVELEANMAEFQITYANLIVNNTVWEQECFETIK